MNELVKTFHRFFQICLNNEKEKKIHVFHKFSCMRADTDLAYVHHVQMKQHVTQLQNYLACIPSKQMLEQDKIKKPLDSINVKIFKYVHALR